MTIQQGVEKCLETIIRRGINTTETRTREGRRAIHNHQLTVEKCGKIACRTRKFSIESSCSRVMANAEIIFQFESLQYNFQDRPSVSS